MTLPITDIVVAETDKDFDQLLRKSAMIVPFLTRDDSERFSQKHGRLRETIEVAISRILGAVEAETHTSVGYDWWPDHTQHIETDTEAFRQPIFDAWRKLLEGEFDEWRIQVVVYRGTLTESGNSMIGSIAIWRDKLIIDKALYGWMRREGLDFHFSGEPRFFSLQRDDLKSPRYNLMNDHE